MFEKTLRPNRVAAVESDVVCSAVKPFGPNQYAVIVAPVRASRSVPDRTPGVGMNVFSGPGKPVETPVPPPGSNTNMPWPLEKSGGNVLKPTLAPLGDGQFSSR